MMDKGNFWRANFREMKRFQEETGTPISFRQESSNLDIFGNKQKKNAVSVFIRDGRNLYAAIEILTISPEETVDRLGDG